MMQAVGGERAPNQQVDVEVYVRVGEAGLGYLDTLQLERSLECTKLIDRLFSDFAERVKALGGKAQHKEDWKLHKGRVEWRAVFLGETLGFRTSVADLALGDGTFVVVIKVERGEGNKEPVALHELLAVEIGNTQLKDLPVRTFFVTGKWAPPSDPSFIIDIPSATMKLDVGEDGQLQHESAFLGVDLAELRRLVAEECAKGPEDVRGKALLAIVRGRGGGKTRTLEELRWSLLTEEPRDTLPIAITFNNQTTFSGEVEGCFGTSPVEAAVMSVAARMLFALRVVPCEFKDFVKLLGERLGGRHIDKSALGQLLEHAVETANAQRVKRDPDATMATKAVLMVDEGHMLLEGLNRRFPGNKRLLEDYVSQAFRQGVLAFKPQQQVGMALVISSLVGALVQKETPGRAVRPFPLPESLSSEEVLERWWGYDPSKVDATLSALAAVVCSLPRAAQLTLQELEKCGKPNRLSKAQLHQLWKRVVRQLDTWYSPCPLSTTHWYSAVFGEDVLVSEVAGAIVQSVFVNAPKHYGGGAYIVPKLSAVSLNRVQLESGDAPLQGKVQTVVNTILTLEDEREGALLERCLREWLEIRLGSAMGKPRPKDEPLGAHPTLSIGELLTVKWLDIAPFCNERIVVGELPMRVPVRPRSRDSLDAFCRVMGRAVRMSSPTLFALHPDEAFDAMVTLPVEGGKVFVLLFECKSAAECLAQGKEGGKEPLPTFALPGRSQDYGNQAKHVHNKVVAWCKDANNQHHIEQNSPAEAFAQGRWAMVHLTTNPNIVVGRVTDDLTGKSATEFRVGDLRMARLCEGDEAGEVGWVLRLGRGQLEKFFGPLFDLYRSGRAANKP